MSWTAAAIQKATAPRQVPRERPVATAAVDSPGAGRGTGRTQQNQPAVTGPDLPQPAYGTLPGPCTWLFAGGTVAVALAADHFGERERLVLTGPKDPARLAAVLATLLAYYAPAATPAAGDSLETV